MAKVYNEKETTKTDKVPPPVVPIKKPDGEGRTSQPPIPIVLVDVIKKVES